MSYLNFYDFLTFNAFRPTQRYLPIPILQALYLSQVCRSRIGLIGVAWLTGVLDGLTEGSQGVIIVVGQVFGSGCVWWVLAVPIVAWFKLKIN